MSETKQATIDERIATLEALLERSMVRKVLEQRLVSVTLEIKKSERLLERERAWSASLEVRIEELEQGLGVIGDLADDGVVIMGQATPERLAIIRARSIEVLGERADGAFCPTCSQRRDNSS